MGWLKQQKSLSSANQISVSARSHRLPSKTLEETPSSPHSAILGVPWFADALLLIPPRFPLCVSCILPLFIRTPLLLHLVPTLMHYDLILTHYTYKGLISKLSHILRFRVDVNFGWMPRNSECHIR